MYEKINVKLWDVQKYIATHFGVTLDQASVIAYPLTWWVNTGRASTPMLKALLNAKTFMVARKLNAPGSHDECLKRVLDYLVTLETR